MSLDWILTRLVVYIPINEIDWIRSCSQNWSNPLFEHMVWVDLWGWRNILAKSNGNCNMHVCKGSTERSGEKEKICNRLYLWYGDSTAGMEDGCGTHTIPLPHLSHTGSFCRFPVGAAGLVVGALTVLVNSGRVPRHTPLRLCSKYFFSLLSQHRGKSDKEFHSQRAETHYET